MFNSGALWDPEAEVALFTFGKTWSFSLDFNCFGVLREFLDLDKAGRVPDGSKFSSEG